MFSIWIHSGLFIIPGNKLEKPVENEELRKLFNSYQIYYLANYWMLFMKWQVHLMLSLIIWVTIFVGPFTITCFKIWTSSLSLMTIILTADFFVKRRPYLLKSIHPYVLFAYSLNFTIRNVAMTDIRFYEVWPVFDFFAISMWIVHFIEFKRIVKSYIFSKFVYISLMTLKHGKLNFEFYFVFWSTSLMFTVTAISVSTMIRHLLTLIYENKELVSSIKKILEVFPEAVLIKTIVLKENPLSIYPIDSDSNKDEIKFINNSALNDIICKSDNSLNFRQLEKLNLRVKEIKIIDPLNNERHLNSTETSKLTDFLKRIEEKLLETHSEIITQIELINQPFNIDNLRSSFDSSSEEYNPQIYTLKSVLVKWEESESCWMHVFVDRSDYVKFTKEKETNECLQMMFSWVSHEFRTPLNAFNTSLNLIELNHDKFWQIFQEKVRCSLEDPQVKKVRESVEKFIKISRVSSMTLLNLTEDILDLAKMEAGIFKLNEQNFEIRSLVEDINYVFVMQFQAKRVHFEVIISDDLLDQEFNSDIGRIKQITLNLLSNSLKFTTRGSVIVRIWIEKIGSNILNSEKYLYISVSDTGVGISDGDFKSLFKMFGMISKYRGSHNSKGTGLGLTISKKLAKSLGGDIEVQSKEGVGSIFTLKIKENSQASELYEEIKDEVAIPMNHQTEDFVNDCSSEIHESKFCPEITKIQDIKNMVFIRSKFLRKYQ